MRSFLLSPLSFALLVLTLGACGSHADDGGSDESEEAATASKRKCTALTKRILKAPMSPPSQFGTFDLAAGKANPRGLTIDEANAAHCATALPDAPTPDFGGF